MASVPLLTLNVRKESLRVTFDNGCGQRHHVFVDHLGRKAHHFTVLVAALIDILGVDDVLGTVAVRRPILLQHLLLLVHRGESAELRSVTLRVSIPMKNGLLCSLKRCISPLWSIVSN